MSGIDEALRLLEEDERKTAAHLDRVRSAIAALRALDPPAKDSGAVELAGTTPPEQARRLRRARLDDLGNTDVVVEPRPEPLDDESAYVPVKERLIALLREGGEGLDVPTLADRLDCSRHSVYIATKALRDVGRIAAVPTGQGSKKVFFLSEAERRIVPFVDPESVDTAAPEIDDAAEFDPKVVPKNWEKLPLPVDRRCWSCEGMFIARYVEERTCPKCDADGVPNPKTDDDKPSYLNEAAE